MATSTQVTRCVVTGKVINPDLAVSFESVRGRLARLIHHHHPGFIAGTFISREELGRYRMIYAQQVLEAELGQLSVLEQDVVRSLRDRELITRNITEEIEEKLSYGQKLADRIAEVGGSWTFIGGFVFFLVVWVFFNTWIWSIHPPDPYPFIFLNLLLSCVAALQAPVIMMSQNRQAFKDRQHAEQDYKVNLKAELEIRVLHEKIDHLLHRHNQRLLELQELQLDLLRELTEQPARRPRKKANQTKRQTRSTQ